MKVLIAENEPRTLQFLTDIFDKEGFEVISAVDGYDAYQEYSFSAPDFVVLDIAMPKMTGIEVCEKIRAEDNDIPIIFLTAKALPEEIVEGLGVGADDYITKPFDIHVVIAKIRSIARRCYKHRDTRSHDEVFKMNNLQIFPQKLIAMKGDEEISLSIRELKILKILYRHKNNIVSRDDLLDYCWGRHIMPESRTVDWHISQLRKKVEDDPKTPFVIQTVHGVGYKFTEVD